MRVLVFASLFLAARAAKLQGYVSQQPQSNILSLPPPLSRDDFPAPADFDRPTGSIFSQTGQSFFTPGPVSSGPSSQSFGSGSSQSFGEFPDPSASVFPSSHSSGISGNIGALPRETFQPSNQQQSPGFQSSSVGFDGSSGSCSEGQVRHFDGTCVTPEVTQKVFVYSAPPQEPRENTIPQDIPVPKVEHNIVFIRTEDGGNGQDPIIVPPPQKKHIIYVLNKESEEGQKVIEITTPAPKNPEVFFINYGEGETPTLPNGIDFETALNSAIHAEGQIIGGGNNQHSDGNTNFVDDSVLGGFNGLEGNFISGGAENILSSGEENFISGTPGNFVTGNEGGSNFKFNTENAQTLIANENGFSGSNSNVFGGISGNNFESSTSNVGSSVPQQLYISP